MSRDQVLSQNELDALVDSVSSGEIPLDEGDSYSNCQPFDFSTREQSLLAQMPALKTINEKHALGLGRGIRELFKIPVDVSARDVRMVKLSEVLVSVPVPSAINLVKSAPLNGITFLITPGELTSFFVDHYFGGSAAAERGVRLSSELTPTERRINEVVATRFLLTLQAAWSDKVSLTAELLGTETNPDFLSMGAPDQLVVNMCFDIAVGDWQSTMEWIVPYAALEPLKSKLGGPGVFSGAAEGNVDWEGFFRNELPAVDLEVSALFASNAVSIAQIVGLKRGAIVPLRVPTAVTLCIEGRPFCIGEHGASNGKKSVKLTELPGRR